MKPADRPIAPLDSFVKVGTVTYKVGAVRWDGSERYYFLIDGLGDVAMFPADVVEAGR